MNCILISCVEFSNSSRICDEVLLYNWKITGSKEMQSEMELIRILFLLLNSYS